MKSNTQIVNLALVSPVKEVYSETFIRAQKELLPFNIFYYSGGFKATELEGYGSIIDDSDINKAIFRIKQKVTRSNESWHDYKIKLSFRKNKIDLVLAQYGPTGVAMLPVCKALKIPLIVHFHGYDASVQKVLDTYKEGYREIFEYAAHIIAVSNAMRRKLLGLGCPENKIAFITCAPNDLFLDVKPGFKEKHFVGLGRFTDKKAPYLTILAFSEVLKQFPDAKLTIGGDGKLLNACNNLVKYLEIEDAVSLPGKLAPVEFRELLTRAVAFVQHSITAENGDSEGTPLAVLESSAAGLPVISTRHAGIPDVIIDSETGLLIDENDVQGMAAAMKKILADTDLARKMGNTGKQRIRKYFTMDKYISRLTEKISGSILDKLGLHGYLFCLVGIM